MRSWTGAIVSLSALPGPSGSGRSIVSPWNSSRSRASALRTTAMYSRVRRSCLAKRWPCQPSATWGPEEPIPSSIRLREPAEDRRGVGPVRLRRPDGVVAERLRLAHELQLLVRAEPEAPVADVHA